MNSSKNIAGLTRAIASLVHVVFPHSTPTEDEFREWAKSLRQQLEPMFPVSNDEFSAILNQLLTTIAVTVDQGIFIADKSEHQPWFYGRKADIDFFYWNRYRQYLEDEKLWNKNLTANLDTVSSQIMDLLGDPQNDSPWRRRGLIMGDVQSGKTATYTAICNKAADAGYKVIIVLAGMQENLRQQTQDRLDQEFTGRKSAQALVPHGVTKPVEFCGVGRKNTLRLPVAFTSVHYDFRTELLKSNNLSLKTITEPALFVVKKNKSVLKNLESWLYSNNAGQDGMIDQPLLLIDDEADNASVNTRAGDQDPTAINQAIRSILARFRRASYVGITATPFANIFIDPESEDDMVGDDLFPRNFIYLLLPPSNYDGADAIFGEDGTGSNVLVPINSEEIETFFPLRHKKEMPVDDLPPSLKEALRYFVLVNAIRDVRGDSLSHRSMLINVSRFTDVHERIRSHVALWLDGLKTDIRNYALLDEASCMQIDTIRELHATWNQHELGAKSGVPFQVLRREYLLRSIEPVEIRAVNQRTGASSLNYADHSEGFRVIAIGGNSLSRGLTLEGLCVSYFYRNSQMYDTLLQMGRWFGYHANYQDLYKIWMSKEAIDWYGYICGAANELKDEIGKMNRLNRTPQDFGLEVRQDPSSLIATARNKMRSATPVQRPISVAGKLIETPRLKALSAVLEDNRRVFADFIKSVDEKGCSVEGERGHFWTGVPREIISVLLRSFETHPMHFAFQGRAIADYIDRMDNLEFWDVYVPNGSQDAFRLDGFGRQIEVRPQERFMQELHGMIMVSGTKVRVGSAGETKVGLTNEQKALIKKAWDDMHPEKPNVPDSEYLIPGRTPLLIGHVLAPKNSGKAGERSPNIPDILFALGVGIPRDDKGVVMANYVVNKVWMLEEGMYDDEEDDPDGDVD